MLENIYQDIISPDVNLAGSIVKLVLSLLLGAIIGFERRRKGQIAGMRTFALISMGATLAMLISIYIPQEYLGLKNGDPGRIAAHESLGARLDYCRWHLDGCLHRSRCGCRYVFGERHSHTAHHFHSG